MDASLAGVLQSCRLNWRVHNCYPLCFRLKADYGSRFSPHSHFEDDTKTSPTKVKQSKPRGRKAKLSKESGVVLEVKDASGNDTNENEFNKTNRLPIGNITDVQSPQLVSGESNKKRIYKKRTSVGKAFDEKPEDISSVSSETKQMPAEAIKSKLETAKPEAEGSESPLKSASKAKSTPESETPSSNGSASEFRKSKKEDIPAGEYNESGEEDDDEEDEELEMEEGFKMKRVCNKLVDVFYVEKTTPDEWRKLLAFSKEWSKIRPHFYKRCRARAKEVEDPAKRADLLKLARRLKEVDDDMMRHNELLEYIESQDDLDAVVFKRRKDFTGDFFDHLRLLCDVNYDNPQRREELAALAMKCVTAVNVHDNFVENEAVMGPAQAKFDDILLSPSLEVACAKIDDLAKKRELDPALMLLFTKAWSAAKESTMMKDEVKDIMYHLYMQMRASMQRLVPKEVRIMRHIISLDDPRQQFEALTASFSPGDEYEGKDEDYLYTTPKKLYKWVTHVLDAYYTNRENTLIKEAQKLMNPTVIKRIEILKDMLEDQFL